MNYSVLLLISSKALRETRPGDNVLLVRLSLRLMVSRFCVGLEIKVLSMSVGAVVVGVFMYLK